MECQNPRCLSAAQNRQPTKFAFYGDLYYCDWCAPADYHYEVIKDAKNSGEPLTLEQLYGGDGKRMEETNERIADAMKKELGMMNLEIKIPEENDFIYTEEEGGRYVYQVKAVRPMPEIDQIRLYLRYPHQTAIAHACRIQDIHPTTDVDGYDHSKHLLRDAFKQVPRETMTMIIMHDRDAVFYTADPRPKIDRVAGQLTAMPDKKYSTGEYWKFDKINEANGNLLFRELYPERSEGYALYRCKKEDK